MSKKIFLVDGYALIYRSFFAFINRPLITDEGENISAIYGFFNSFLRMLDRWAPDKIIVLLDSGSDTFRHQFYADYKATREKMPDELKSQIPYIYEMLDAAGIIKVSQNGYEADDLIGKIAADCQKDYQVYIYSSDKDMYQLVNNNTVILDPRKDTIIDHCGVQDKLGVTPEQIIDYLALMGDNSDNIPGVKGIGAKTASKLLSEFHDLDNIYQNISNIKSASLSKKLSEGKHNAYLSRKLVKIPVDFDLNYDLNQTSVNNLKIANLASYFKKYKMTSLLKYINNSLNNNDIIERYDDSSIDYQLKKVIDYEQFIQNLKSGTTLSLIPVMNDNQELAGIAISKKEKEAFLFHDESQKSLFEIQLSSISSTISNLTIKLLKKDVNIVCSNYKQILHILNLDKEYVKATIYDLALIYFINNPDKQNIRKIIEDTLNYELIEYNSVFKKNNRKISYSDIAKENLKKYYGEEADLLLRLYQKTLPEIWSHNSTEIYEKIEMPLSSILYQMERKGILIDKNLLENYNEEIINEIRLVEKHIFSLAGLEFNLSSPKQLNHILGDKMGLTLGKKGKSGLFSTDSKSLHKLASSGEDIAVYLLKYRELTKLKSTYLDGLLKEINATDGRIHTTYNQIQVATGRLSSVNPNLQNIPIKTTKGEIIRKAFIAPADYLLVSADYSQIELRVMAHYSQDDNLMLAFKEDQDIHAYTASILFDKSIDDVNKLERNRAKITNFSLLYGKTAFGLSQDLNISFQEANSFIEHYFDKFPKIKNYMKEVEDLVKENGFVSTVLGRKRYFPEIRSSNKNIINNALRAAINSPIQGTAAEILKLAMIKIKDNIHKYKANMLLQIHDELVFEVPEKNITEFSNFVRDCMENAYKLHVPLKVDIGSGKNWLEAH